MITILKFWAEWCTPCQNLKPAWEKVQEELKDEFLFQSVDIDANPQSRLDYHVRTIPMIIAVQNGKEIGRRQGSGTSSEIKGWINEQRDLQRNVLPE